MKPTEGREYELEIESISSDGRGVGHIGQMTVFVPNAAVGDKARIRVLRVRRRYAEAELIGLTEPSADRVEPQCGLFYECGGCALLHMSYAAQLEAKRVIIENAFQRIGGFKEMKLNSISGADSQFRYRNKMIFHAGEADGKTIFGFYAPKSHRVIPLGDCLIGDKKNNELINALTAYMEETGLKPYNERTGRGSVRMLFTRRSRRTGGIMVVISVNGKGLPQKEMLIDMLTNAVSEVKSIILNVNNAKHSIGLGAKNIVLYGEGYIEDELLGIRYRISPGSFFQINPAMTERLYAKAIELADIGKDDTVMDIYCGIGTISLTAAKCAKQVIGVEIAEQAIADAQKNAAANGIVNADFYASSAENIVPKLISEGERPDIVILDPPRKGSDAKTLEAILKAAPKRIVYISCDPATLARDAKVLCGGGYEIKQAYGYDMFPNTCHVETVCLLSKLKSSEHIEVKLSMDELDLTAAEKKATYQEIRDYVLEHYGLNVSQLNIAQVKRKCGIMERENYNKPKNENSKQPQCTPEKEAAITETLRHFGMI